MSIQRAVISSRALGGHAASALPNFHQSLTSSSSTSRSFLRISIILPSPSAPTRTFTCSTYLLKNHRRKPGSLDRGTSENIHFINAEKEKKAKREGVDPSEVTDPNDMTQVKKELQEAMDDFKLTLTKLRPDGRLTPEVLEQMRLPSGSHGNRKYVHELCTIVSKGRTFELMVHDEENVKHLAKLIQSTVYSLNPRIDPENTNPNLIVVEVPPATAESRARVIEEVSQLSNRVNRYITAARANQQKRHRQMRLNKIARPDDIDKGMFACNDLCKAANEEQKAITEKFKKAVQGSGETIDKKTWNNRNNFLARNKTLN